MCDPKYRAKQIREFWQWLMLQIFQFSRQRPPCCSGLPVIHPPGPPPNHAAFIPARHTGQHAQITGILEIHGQR